MPTTTVRKPASGRDTRTWYVAKVLDPKLLGPQFKRGQRVFVKRGANPGCWIVFAGSARSQHASICNDDAKKSVESIRTPDGSTMIAKNQERITEDFEKEIWG